MTIYAVIDTNVIVSAMLSAGNIYCYCKTDVGYIGDVVPKKCEIVNLRTTGTRMSA